MARIKEAREAALKSLFPEN